MMGEVGMGPHTMGGEKGGDIDGELSRLTYFKLTYSLINSHTVYIIKTPPFIVFIKFLLFQVKPKSQV